MNERFPINKPYPNSQDTQAGAAFPPIEQQTLDLSMRGVPQAEDPFAGEEITAGRTMHAAADPEATLDLDELPGSRQAQSTNEPGVYVSPYAQRTWRGRHDRTDQWAQLHADRYPVVTPRENTGNTTTAEVTRDSNVYYSGRRRA